MWYYIRNLGINKVVYLLFMYLIVNIPTENLKRWNTMVFKSFPENVSPFSNLADHHLERLMQRDLITD